MKRWMVRLAAIVVVLAATTSLVAAANVNNFTISNYDIAMTLGRDDDNRSTLATTETITAVFPNFDQNRGIERAIPSQYDGHGVSLDIVSVTRPDGSDWNYTTYSDASGNTIVRIGDADRYVQGEQTYVINYRQRDVTRHFDNTGRDEFYWDTNGTEWRVPIQNLSVDLTIEDDLRSAITGDAFCYQGTAGSTDRCALRSTETGFAASPQNLSRGENATLAIGFEPETFSGYKMSLLERLFMIWGLVQAAIVPLAIGLLAWVVTKFVRTTNRSRELGTIVPEYLPPSDTSVTTAAKIAKHVQGSVMAAQLIDLAVRHYVTLSEQEVKVFFGKTKLYFVEVIKSVDELKPEEQELLSDMFGHLPAVGESLSLQTLQNNTAYYNRTTDNDKKLRKLVLEQYDLKQVDEPLKKWLQRVAGVTFLLGILILSPALLVVSLIAFILSFNARTLTDSGLALRRYLAGLRDYIKVGEAERLKALQSPAGAEKVSQLAADVDDVKQRVVLYERVLPYAVLFGQEKQWSKELGRYYEQIGRQPDWYTGTAAFNAAAFSTALGSFSTATSNYGGASSSSSGGSSGGGSSGGGGGGGGGGGW